MKRWPARTNLPDVQSCTSEPIHRLGAIQPNGFLLSVDQAWIVLRASENVHHYLATHHTDMIGRPVGAFLGADALHDIRGRLQTDETGVVERLFGQPLVADGQPFDIAVHRSDREFVLEFEPSAGKSGGSLGTLRSMIAGVERHASSQIMFREAARQVRAYTGYDEVLVYRFGDDGTGEVVAEASKKGRAPLLGFRYPASDIPAQARDLYERNYLRTIADVDAPPVRIAQASTLKGAALDLSMSTLRSVSPIHVEYLRNMDVRSSMSISIMRHGRLWGLIACHHEVPIHLDFEMRSTAEMFGQVLSYLLDEQLRSEEAASDTKAQVIHDAVATKFSLIGAISDNVNGFLETVAEYIPADGVGLYSSGVVALCGEGPTLAEFLELIEFLNRTTAAKVFSTFALAEVYPPAAAFAVKTAGLLAIPSSRTPRDFLVFFRQEIVRSTTWAGEPEMVKAVDPTGTRYRPRTSFKAWREMVRDQSKPWNRRELRLAEVMRATLTQIAFQLADQAETTISGVIHRQEIRIAELNHRNRNILGLVRGLISQSAASAFDITSLVECLDDRIRSLASAQDILSSGNQMPSSLHALVRAEVGAYALSDDNLVLRGPDVLLVAKAYSAMAMVVHELVTNARKHGALSSAQGRVAIDVADDQNGDVTISWREMGGPPVLAPTRRGFGTTVLEQTIPFEVNGTSSLLYLREGVAFGATLPKAAATCIAVKAKASTERPVEDEGAHGDETSKLAGLLRCTLLVEDNLFIAVDAENMLFKLGAGSIEIVKTVAEALAAVAGQAFTFALLDVNLGGENSLPIALALQAKGVPFVFGTGYGEIIGMPHSLEQIELVSKPYSRHSVRAALLKCLTTPSP